MRTAICTVCSIQFRPRPGNPGRFCSIACKAEWQRSQKPVTKEWLYQKYVVEGLTAVEIARQVKRNSKRVWEWLRDYGIPTRPRGSYAGVHFQLGQPSAFAGHRHTAEVKEQLRQRRYADGHVPYLQDGRHHLKGKRGADTPNWKGGVTPERQAFYSSPAWSAAVKAVWQRDDARCQRCGLDHRTIDRSVMRFHIHHIDGFANKALRAEASNLILLCGSCHRFVHSRRNTTKEFLHERDESGRGTGLDSL